MQYEDGRQLRLSVTLPSLIGRDPSSQIRIDHWRVGKSHAKISRTGDFLQIQDLGTFIGTRVNGVSKPHHYPLLPTDEIIIGPCRMKLQLVSQPVAAPDILGQAHQTDEASVLAEPSVDPGLRAALHAELIELFDLRKSTCQAYRMPS